MFSLGLGEAAGHEHRHDRRLAIGGHEAVVVEQVVVTSAGHDVASQREDPREHGVNLGPEGRVVHRQRLGLNDDDFGDGLRCREPLRQQGGRLLRLEAAGQPELGGRGAFEQIHVERGGNDHQRHPGADGQPRPSHADASQQFSQGQIPRTPGRRTRPNCLSSRVAQPARHSRRRPLSLLGAGTLAPIRIHRMSVLRGQRTALQAPEASPQRPLGDATRPGLTRTGPSTIGTAIESRPAGARQPGRERSER